MGWERVLIVCLSKNNLRTSKKYRMVGVYIDWTNSLDPVKSTQSNHNKWVGLGKWWIWISKMKNP
jgi:hypothetical protein